MQRLMLCVAIRLQVHIGVITGPIVDRAVTIILFGRVVFLGVFMVAASVVVSALSAMRVLPIDPGNVAFIASPDRCP
jgi:hypothetical protein